MKKNRIYKDLKEFTKIIILRFFSIFLDIYTKKTNNSFDNNWFKDKKVAIVGGADSVLNDKLGKFIDSFDVVVRINNGLIPIPMQKDYIGEKTDFLFHSFYVRNNDAGSSPIDIDLFSKKVNNMIIFANNYKCSIYSLRNFIYFIKITKNKLKFSQINKKQFFENKNILHPFGATTGFSAINTILNCKPKELYITGFTFFKTPHNSAYRTFKKDEPIFQSGSHNAEEEYKYIKKLYYENKNIIKVDKTLLKIFESNN